MASKKIAVKLTLTPDLNVKALNTILTQLKNALGPLGKDIKLIDPKKVKPSLDEIASDHKGLQNKIKKQATEGGKKAGKGFAFGFKGGFTSVKDIFAGNVLANAFTKIAGSGKAAFDAFVDLDREVKNIGTLGRENFEEFSEGALRLAKDIPDSAATVANGIYNAISAGITGTNKDILRFVETAAQAAVAGQSDTNAAVKGLSAIINAYGLTAADASRISDTFFATIKLGVTTFEELNNSIAQVIPPASQAGVQLDQVNAALAQITKLGTPTALAATQLNGAFILISKGSPALIQSLKTIGLTLPDLQKKLKAPIAEGGGLVNVLRDIKVASDKANISIFKVTGRKEAALAIEQLAGTTERYNNSLELLSNLQADVAAGASTKAFEVASEGIGIQIGGLMNTIEGVFIRTFQTFLPLIKEVVSTFAEAFDSAEIQDVLKGLATVFSGVFEGILGVLKIVGGAIKALIAPLSLFAGSGETVQKTIKALTAAAIGGAIAIKAFGVVTVATKTAIEASTVGLSGFAKVFRALQVVIAANPFGALLVGVTAIIVAYQVFSQSASELAEEQLELSETYRDGLVAQEKVLKEQEKSIIATQDLIGEYDRLARITDKTTEETEKFKKVEEELNQQFPKSVELGGKVADNMNKLAIATDLVRADTSKLNKESRALVNEYNRLSRTSKDATKNQDRLREIYNKITNEELVPLIDGTTDFNSGLRRMADITGRTAKGLGEVRDRLNEIASSILNANQNIVASRLAVAESGLFDIIDDLKNAVFISIAGINIRGLDTTKFETSLERLLNATLKTSKVLEGADIDTAFDAITKKINVRIKKLEDKVADDPVALRLLQGKGDVKVLTDLLLGIDTYKRNLKIAKGVVDETKNSTEGLTDAQKKQLKLDKEAADKLADKTEAQRKNEAAQKKELDRINKLITAAKTLATQEKRRNLLAFRSTDATEKKTKAENENLIVLQKTLDAIKKEFRATVDGTAITISAGISKDAKTKVTNDIINLILSIQEKEKLIKLGFDNTKVKKDIKETSDEIRERLLEQEFEIELGKEGTLFNLPALGKAFKTLQDFLEEQRNIANQKAVELDTELKAKLKEQDEEQSTEKKAELQIQIDELTIKLLEERDLRKEIGEEITENEKTEQEKRADIIDKAAEDNQNFLTKFIGGTQQAARALEAFSIASVESVAAVIKGQEAAGRAVISTSLDILESLINVKSAEALINALSLPDSVLSFGATAFGRAAVVIALMKAALAGVRAAIGFEKGGYTGDGNKSDVAGTVHKREFVMDAEVTKRFRPLLEAIQAGKYNNISIKNIVPFQEGSDLLTTPQLALIGENGPEQVLNQRDFDLIRAVSAQNNADVINKLDNVVDAINNLSRQFFVLDVDVARATNRINQTENSDFSKIVT